MFAWAFALFAQFCRPIYIGLDFGSFFTKASVVISNEHPEIATNYETKRMTPTFIAFRAPPHFNWSDEAITSKEAGMLRPEFGEKALQLMESRPASGTGFLPIFLDMENNSISQLAKDLFISTNASRVSMTDATCVFLRQFLTAIAKGRKIHGVHVTVPSFTTIPQRSMITGMLHAAGVRRARVIDDIEAICCIYSNVYSSRFAKSRRRTLFIDLGATNMQAYIVQFERLKDSKKPFAMRLAYGFDAENGGAFLTAKLVKYIHKSLALENVTDSDNRRLFSAVERLKKQLTLTEEATVTTEIGGNEMCITMDRSELLAQSTDFLASLKRVIEDVIHMKYDEVEIIGGSSRLPFIASFLSEEFNMTQIGHSLNADEALAIGAGYYSQFVTDTSRFETIRVEDYASAYNITMLSINGSMVACMRNLPCLPRVNVSGNGKYLLSVYEGLRNGLLTKSFAYGYPEQTGDCEMILMNGPFDVYNGRCCEGGKCSDFEVTSLWEPFSTPAVLKAIVGGDKRRTRMANAHNRLEQFLNKVEEEIASNETVREFSSEEQRSAIQAELDSAKKWIFEYSDLATDVKNFTDVTDRIKNLINPIYKRISINGTIHEELEMYSRTLTWAIWCIEEEWPGRGIAVPADFVSMYREADDWYKNITAQLRNLQLWQDIPFKPKHLRKRGTALWQELKRINQTAPAQKTPTPTPVRVRTPDLGNNKAAKDPRTTSPFFEKLKGLFEL